MSAEAGAAIAAGCATRCARVSRRGAHGFNLHRLKGERAGEWAIWVSGNWRLTFRFSKGEVHDINLEDYH